MQFEASVNYLTSGRRYIGKDVEVTKMLSWIIGIVTGIGLIWSVAAMSDLVPVAG